MVSIALTRQRARTGYAGPDHVKYEATSENGEVATYDVTITVTAAVTVRWIELREMFARSAAKYDEIDNKALDDANRQKRSSPKLRPRCFHGYNLRRCCAPSSE